MKRLVGLSTRDLFPGGFFYLAIFILFLSLGFIFLSQRVWDYDFWWHIATGRYIVQSGHLPHSDPLSFTSSLPENDNLYSEREQFILTQYWLAQSLMYFLYQKFGAMGIGLLRTILLLGALVAIYRTLNKRRVAPYIMFLSLFLAACNLFRFMGDRPVLFTISFTVVCFVMLDDFVYRRSKAFYFLPVLMLAWANLHGGFILGIAIILVFMAVECAKLLFGRSSFATKEKIFFFSVLFLAIGASAINPNGFFAFEIAFSKVYAPFYQGIQEYQSPFFISKMQFASLDYAYLAALFLFPVVLILRNRKFNPVHFILLLSLAVESVLTGRFTVYYGLIASLVLGNELDLWLKEHQDKFVIKQAHLNIAFSVIMLASSVLYFNSWAKLDAFKARESVWTVPKGAADFIEKNHIKGNMLNDMATGGYLAWRLYPEVKTFIDTRALNYTVMREYAWMARTTESAYASTAPPGKTPLWKRLLDHYKINLIVFSPLDVYGNILPLIMKLIDDDSWVPVHSDVTAIVFLKDVPGNKPAIEKFRLSKDVIYDTIIMKASIAGLRYKKNPYYIASLGDIFLKTGRKEDALKAYENALNRMPDNKEIKEKLDKLKREETEVKSE